MAYNECVSALVGSSIVHLRLRLAKVKISLGKMEMEKSGRGAKLQEVDVDG